MSLLYINERIVYVETHHEMNVKCYCHINYITFLKKMNICIILLQGNGYILFYVNSFQYFPVYSMLIELEHHWSDLT